MNILVIINDDDLFDIISDFLTSFGLIITRAKSNNEIFSEEEKKKFNYCVIDNRDINVILNNKNNNLEYIVLAGYCDRNLNVLKDMFNKILIKPFDLDDLIRMINE